MSVLLTATDIHLKRAGRVVLDGVTLAVHSGELLAILGPNGSGKSTLLKVICGILAPAAGEVRLHGRALSEWRMTQRARQIGYLAQEPELSWDISVEELVGLGAHPATPRFPVNFDAVPGGPGSAVLQELLKTFSLTSLRHRSAQSLSGGERARALLARALAGQPDILLADEPTAHLDVAYQVDIMQHICARCRSHAMAGIVVVHDANLAARFADRIALMREGQLVHIAEARNALADPIFDSIYRQQFERIERNGRTYLLAADSRDPEP